MFDHQRQQQQRLAGRELAAVEAELSFSEEKSPSKEEEEASSVDSNHHSLDTSSCYLQFFTNSKMDFFTTEQKRRLVENWRADDLDWLYDIGVRIYSKIFELAPTAKRLFPYVVQYESEGRDYRESKEFQNQALRFVQALGKGVLSLDDTDEDGEKVDYAKYLYDLGLRHKRLEAERGFKPEYWNVFETAVIRIMSEETAKNQTVEKDGEEKIEDLYAVLANYMILTMKRGFFDLGPE